MPSITSLNLTHFHLLLNHVPTIGSVAALGLFIIAFIRRGVDNFGHRHALPQQVVDIDFSLTRGRIASIDAENEGVIVRLSVHLEVGVD